MKLIDNITKLITDRVNKYGAQYNTLAIFGLINYPLAYLYEYYTNGYKEGLYLRIFATLLCLILLLHDKWPTNLKKFLPLYWYITITFILPILLTFMLLIEKFSLAWLMNFNIGIMITILLLDSLSFLLITGIGIIIGLLSFYFLEGYFPPLPSEDNEALFIYMFICIVVLGTIFTRNKEVFNHYIQKTKDDLNESLEIKVRNRTKELEKALSAKSEFLNNMSHEIRTPVSGFMAISEGLEEHWNVLDEKKKIKYVKDISSSAQRLGSLIGNLLDLSDFIANKNYVNITRFNLTNLINTSINSPKYLQYSKKNVSIHFIASLNEAYVYADKEWISQALDHLFSNALKFTPENGNITISLDQNKKFWEFTISDDGIGIPKNEITEIFNPFT